MSSHDKTSSDPSLDHESIQEASQGKPPRGKISADLLLVGGMLLGWFALQAFVLPSMGVST